MIMSVKSQKCVINLTVDILSSFPRQYVNPKKSKKYFVYKTN